MDTKEMEVRESTRGTMPSACDQCYRCKVRCNGARPACDRCCKVGSSCTYSFGKQGRRTKKGQVKTTCEPHMLSKDHSPPPDPPPFRTQPAQPENSALRPQISCNTSSPASLVGALEEDTMNRGGLEIGFTDFPFEDTLCNGLESKDPELWLVDSAVDMEMDDVSWPEDPWNLDTPRGIPTEGETIRDPTTMVTTDGIAATKPSSSFQLATSSLREHHDQDGSYGSAQQDHCMRVQRPCRCRSDALEYIPTLFQTQMNARMVSVDSTLRTARRALGLLEDCLNCDQCLQERGFGAAGNGWEILTSAFRLILAQVFNCYCELDICCDSDQYNMLPAIAVADDEITDTVIRKRIFKGVLSAERSYGDELSEQLQRWAKEMRGTKDNHL